MGIVLNNLDDIEIAISDLIHDIRGYGEKVYINLETDKGEVLLRTKANPKKVSLGDDYIKIGNTEIPLKNYADPDKWEAVSKDYCIELSHPLLKDFSIMIC